MRASIAKLFTLLVCAAFAAPSAAQESGFDLLPGHLPRDRPMPGEHRSFDLPSGGPVLGGRPGSMRPRVPLRTRPHGPSQVAPGHPSPGQATVETVPTPVEIPNAWSILFEIEDQGPANGLTLQQSVERLVRSSVTLRARAMEIPQAQADVLTAGLYANPIVYADKQLIGYQPYSLANNPGGPAQYDVNVAYPFDVSGKRQARIEVASAAQRVVEALYQDAVRLEVDRLNDAFVDALSARLNLRTARDGLALVDEVQRRAAAERHDDQTADDLRHHLQLQRQTLALALYDAEAAWRNSQRTLASLLDLRRETAASLDLRGSIRDQAPAPPQLEELVRLALANRPDLAAYRLGYQRAVADVRLSKANRLPDVYAMYQPFTYQDNAPFNAPSSRSWAIGATVTVPIFDRNQGNIRRAQVNADQSALERAAIERRVVDDVETAYDSYEFTRKGILQIEEQLLPEIEKARGKNVEKLRSGTLDAAGYLNVQRDLDDLGRQYRELLLRHRRSMLDLNTAVGVRVLP